MQKDVNSFSTFVDFVHEVSTNTIWEMDQKRSMKWKEKALRRNLGYLIKISGHIKKLFEDEEVAILDDDGVYRNAITGEPLQNQPSDQGGESSDSTDEQSGLETQEGVPEVLQGETEDNSQDCGECSEGCKC